MIKLKAMLNEAPNTGERIQNLNNRIKVLRDKISATKSPEQKKLFSDRLKNALQSLSNIKKDHSIKAPHRESVVNEDNTAFETLMLIRNLEQTNKLLAQDLKTSKRLPNDKKENIKKSIVVNQGLINYYKETYKNLKNNESINEEPAKSTGEKIQNLNNRIKALKDKMAATKSSEQKNLIQQKLKNALQTLSNYKKQNVSKESIVNEASVSKLHKDHTKVVEMIQQHLEKYKSSKGTPQAEKHVSELKKLNAVKKKIEADLDSAISGLYKDAELKQD